MTIALFSLADASLAQDGTAQGSKKPPPKRIVQAVADQKLAPEPR